MKSFIRRSLTSKLALGAIGASILSTGLASAALALTQEQVAEKLSDVPVYVLGSDNNLLLVSRNQEGQQTEPSLLVFMSEQRAEEFLAQATANNPEFAPDAQVELANLESIYQESQTSSGEDLRLVYVPEEEEASRATALDSAYPGGVPLFFPTLEDGSIMPMQQSDGETILPMFFSQSDLDVLLADLAEANPEARDAVTVSVYPLEAMLLQMQDSDDEAFERIRLLPDSEIINDIRTQQAPSGQ